MRQTTHQNHYDYNNSGYNHHANLERKRKLNRRKVALTVLLLIIVIVLIFIVKNSMDAINQYRVYQEYQAQLVKIQEEEQRKQAEIEAEKERIRQERIPKLTQTR